jgi:N-methylhydantoinase A
MDPDRFLGGRFKLDRAAAENALNRHVAKPLGITIEAAAAAIFSIVNAKMADLVRKVSVERGHDPRDFLVCAYGGLGPLHAPFYAADLNAKAVMVPLGELSSVFSAYGIAMADILHVHELSCSLREPLSFRALDELFAILTREADAQLEADEIRPNDRLMRRFAEVRYVGQLNEMMVEVPKASIGFDVQEEFERRYVEAFGPGAAWKEAPIEIVALRLEAAGKRRQFPMRARQAAASHVELRCKRRVYRPESDPVKGTAALTKFIQGVLDEGVSSVALTTLEVVGQGRYATNVGSYVMKDKAAKEIDHGKYMELWRLEKGAWKLHRDIFNSSVPPKK